SPPAFPAATPPTLSFLMSKFCTRTDSSSLVGETDRPRREFRRIKDAMFSRRTAFLPLIAVAFLSMLPAFAAAQNRRELRIGVVGVPSVVDPASGLDGAAPLIARHVFDTLVAYRDGSTDVEPALATRWSVSRDGLTWSFGLRDNARFHDGTHLTAHEAAMSFSRYLRPEGEIPPSAAWAALLRGGPGVIKDVRVAD